MSETTPEAAATSGPMEVGTCADCPAFVRRGTRRKRCEACSLRFKTRTACGVERGERPALQGAEGEAMRKQTFDGGPLGRYTITTGTKEELEADDGRPSVPTVSGAGYARVDPELVTQEMDRRGHENLLKHAMEKAGQIIDPFLGYRSALPELAKMSKLEREGTFRDPDAPADPPFSLDTLREFTKLIGLENTTPLDSTITIRANAVSVQLQANPVFSWKDHMHRMDRPANPVVLAVHTREPGTSPLSRATGPRRRQKKAQAVRAAWMAKMRERALGVDREFGGRKP